MRYMTTKDENKTINITSIELSLYDQWVKGFESPINKSNQLFREKNNLFKDQDSILNIPVRNKYIAKSAVP